MHRMHFVQRKTNTTYTLTTASLSTFCDITDTTEQRRFCFKKILRRKFEMPKTYAGPTLQAPGFDCQHLSHVLLIEVMSGLNFLTLGLEISVTHVLCHWCKSGVNE